MHFHTHVVFSFYQVWAAAVSTGPDNISLNASYKNADGYAFQVLALRKNLILLLPTCQALLCTLHKLAYTSNDATQHLTSCH